MAGFNETDEEFGWRSLDAQTGNHGHFDRPSFSFYLGRVVLYDGTGRLRAFAFLVAGT